MNSRQNNAGSVTPANALGSGDGVDGIARRNGSASGRGKKKRPPKRAKKLWRSLLFWQVKDIVVAVCPGLRYPG